MAKTLLLNATLLYMMDFTDEELLELAEKDKVKDLIMHKIMSGDFQEATLDEVKIGDEV